MGWYATGKSAPEYIFIATGFVIDSGSYVDSHHRVAIIDVIPKLMMTVPPVTTQPLLLLCLLAFLSLPAHGSTPETVNELLSSGDYETALTAAEEGIAANPDDQQLKLQKGFALIRLRRLDEAEEYYRQLIDLLPDEPEPMNNLGVVYQLQRRYPEAIRQLNSTIERFPDFVRAYENLGDTYVRIAAIQYDAGLRRMPTDASLSAKSDLSQNFYRLARDQRRDTTDGTQEPQQSAEANPEGDIAQFLRSWVAAWSSRDVDAYLAHYSEDFDPAEGLSLAQWKDRKSRIIRAAEYIKLRVEDIEVTERNEDQINLAFNQSYESNPYQSNSRKTMRLNRENGAWRIAQER